MSVLRVAEDVTFSYPGDDRYVYRVPAGFSIGRGDKVCISGVSGSGKSTILTLLTGLRRFQTGTINYTFSDRVQIALSSRNWSAGPRLWSNIGFGFQRPELIGALSVVGNMRLALGAETEAVGEQLFPSPQPDDASNGDAAKPDPDAQADEERTNPRGVDARLADESLSAEWQDVRRSRVDQLSGGQTQRLGLARAFGLGQSLVILDEPTNNLDKNNRKLVADFITERSTDIGLLVVSHDTEFVDLLKMDQVIKIEQVRGAGGQSGRVVRSLAA